MTRIDLRDTEKAEDRTIKRDVQTRAFLRSDRDTRHQWIDDNVNSVADAKVFLKRLSDVVALVAREAMKG